MIFTSAGCQTDPKSNELSHLGSLSVLRNKCCSLIRHSGSQRYLQSRVPS